MRIKGFTLLELLMVMGILGIIAFFSFSNLLGYREKQSIKNATSEIVNGLRSAQARSMTQENGYRWGVHFENPASGDSFFEIFWGTNYLASNAVSKNYLPNKVKFLSPVSNSSSSVIFSPLAGQTENNFVVTIAKDNINYGISDIVIKKNGQVSSYSEDGLVGYWHFDEGEGMNAYDASGYGNNGTLVNSPTWQSSSSCKAGRCLSFNGVNNRIDFPGVSSFKTISLWANIQQGSLLSSNRWSFYSDYYMWYSGGNINFQENPQVPIAAAINTNQWVNIVVICASGIKNTLYVNGVFASQQGSASSLDCSRLYLGFNHIGSDFFSGLIDEVRIYNRALLSTEIQSLYNALK